jgi:carboxypeptidase Q
VKKILRVVALLPLLTLFPVGTFAQLPPTNPSPLQVPTGSGTCSVEKSCDDLAPAMIQSALGPSPLEENLRYLTDSIGGRPTGSPAADRAAGWAVEALRRAGVDEVHTEKFTIPLSWSEGNSHIEILSPELFPVRMVSIGWSPATPTGGITADVVDVGDGSENGFAKAGALASGGIVLVHTNLLTTWEDLITEYDVDHEIVDRAVKAGAAAIFWMSTRPNLLLYRHNVSINGELERLPQAILAREDAERIARFLSAGQKVRARLDMPNHIGGPTESENVIGEIRGREKPEEFVLLGAHLDSWDLGTGALDDGCNVAMLIDAARVIHSSGAIPRRSIRFAFFTGEEQGMLGSAAYAHAHRAELDRMIAAVIFDSGVGRIIGYSLGGRKDIEPAVREALQPLHTFTPLDFTFDAGMDTDNFDFILEGVPTLEANQEPANYMLNYHAASDTYDKVDFKELKRSVAVAAITAFALADRPERIGPRQSRPQIEQLFQQTGLDKELKQAGFWPLWEKSERGRQP